MIKYLHLRPYLFLTDKRNVIKNPHKLKKKQLKIISFLRLLIWFFLYKLFFYFNVKKKKQIIIFDRYVHDIIIDPIRYRFNLSSKLKKKILSFFPEPHLWIILNVDPKIAYKRKKEISLKETIRQSNEYIKFKNKKKNSILVNTSNSIDKSASKILKEMNKICNNF